MSESILNTLVQKFIKNPNAMNCGAGKLARRNNTTEEIVKNAKVEARKQLSVTSKSVPPKVTTTSETSFDENKTNHTGILSYKGPKEIKSEEDLVAECNIDLSIWNIDRIIHNSWGKEGNLNFQVKAFLSKKKKEVEFQESFEDFLKTYVSTHKPSHTIFEKVSFKKNACLVINKQDEHLNKYDTSGNNDMKLRFTNFLTTLDIVLQQAAISNNIEKILYIVGSDEFNSEWTTATTKGTPQQNIHNYQDSFKMICNYEITVIDQLLLSSQEVEIKYIPGNHDEYVGWHLITWLQAYYKNDKRITFDTSVEYTKYMKYSNTAMMFNHGDVLKPTKLAAMFPMEFKNNWSSCDNFYIFTGDKHHEKSEDMNGIVFYQLPSLSTAKSMWDKKGGYTNSKAELTAFVIEEDKGRTIIFKQPLN